MTCSRTGLTARAGLGAGVLSLVLLTAPIPGLSLAGVLLLACVVPGSAVMCWVDSGEGFAQAGLTLAMSLTVLALSATIMIWAQAWHPRLLAVSAVLSLASCGLRLLQGPREPEARA
jgi:hypothetical protein